jgi:predicted GNAT family N-acyltransferase
MSEIKIIRAENQYTYALCMALRYECFVIEQNCPLLEELTPHEDDCHHYLAVCGEIDNLDYVPMGTARWREYEDGIAKIERVATKAEYRGKGVASKLIKQIIEDIKAAGGYKKIVLGAQDTAMPLYEKQGFLVYGEGFVEAGIDHHMMEKVL